MTVATSKKSLEMIRFLLPIVFFWWAYSVVVVDVLHFILLGRIQPAAKS